MSQVRSISITQLSKWFGAFQALRDIDLDVQKGERIVICGPSGSGKSTLIRCINGLESYQQGRIEVEGTVLADSTKSVHNVRRDVGMVFQHFNLFPHLTVLENCTLAPIWVRRIGKQQAEDVARSLLERVRIGEQAQAGSCRGHHGGSCGLWFWIGRHGRGWPHAG